MKYLHDSNCLKSHNTTKWSTGAKQLILFHNTGTQKVYRRRQMRFLYPKGVIDRAGLLKDMHVCEHR